MTKDSQLRDYQDRYKSQIYELWLSHQSIMLQMPTGTGKTRLFASIVKDIHNLGIQNKKALKVLILAHRQELIKQISENIGIKYGIAHGKIMSKNWEEEFYPTQVASVQTLTRRLEKWGNKKFDFIIIDEAHHALAPTYVKICNEFPNAKILGVTATPYRMSRLSFRPMFNELIVSDSISQFIKNGYLSEYEYYSIKPTSKIQNLIDNITEFDFDGDYAEKALSSTFDKDVIRANLLETYFKYANGKKGIVYTINKSHNERVCKMFVNAGINAKSIDSETKSEDRNSIVKEFRNGTIQILCNVNIFSEGFDCPDLEFIQLARPTKSLSMFLQQVGRGFRIHEEKDKVIFLDNVGLYNKFGLPSANRKWLNYFDGNPDVEEEHTTQIDSTKKVNFIEIEIDEGDETVELIFTSSNSEDIIIPINKEFDEILDFDLLVYHNDEIDLNNIPTDKLFLFNLYGICSYEDLMSDFEEESLFDENFKKYSHIKKIRINDKWGLWDNNQDKIIIEAKYDDIVFYSIYNQVKIIKDGKCGLVNPITGEILVSEIFDSIEKIISKPNYHILSLNKQYDIVSKENNFSLDLECYNVIEFNGFFNLELENEWQLFDNSLALVENQNFEFIGNFSNYDIVKFEDRIGFVSDGKLLYPFLNESYRKIGDRFIILKFLHNRFCVLNHKLELIIKPIYEEIEFIKKGFFKVRKGKLYGICTSKGKLLLKEKYYSCGFYENHFIVNIQQKWTAINLKGIEVQSFNSKKNLLKTLKILKSTIKNKATDDFTLPQPNKFEDPFLKAQQEKNDKKSKLIELFNDISTSTNSIDRTIRINKIKSELKITNSEIEALFELVNIDFDNNPNSKLTEAEYVFIKNVIEIKDDEVRQKNKLTNFEDFTERYDNVEKSILINKTLRELNINLRTAIKILKSVEKNEIITINSKITLADYHFLKYEINRRN
jgi:superfamily II DNA or RNA helicase